MNNERRLDLAVPLCFLSQSFLGSHVWSRSCFFGFRKLLRGSYSCKSEVRQRVRHCGTLKTELEIQISREYFTLNGRF